MYTVVYSIFITSDLAFSVVIFPNHVTLVSCKSDWIAQCSGFMLQWPLLHLPFYWLARWHSYFYVHVSRGKTILCYNYSSKTVHVQMTVRVHLYTYFFFLFLHSNSNCWKWKERNLFRQVRLEYMQTCANAVQTDTTLLANNSQHCWMLHVSSVCTPSQGCALRKILLKGSQCTEPVKSRVPSVCCIILK